MPTNNSRRGGYTVPGLDEASSATLVGVLQERLTALTDLHLTLKHVHWNVVGPHFIAVHEMLDPQVEDVRAMTDEIAERIATLGGSPVGTMGAMAASRTWEDYSLARAVTTEHLGALDVVYQGVISDQREAIEKAEADPVSEDMLIGQAAKLELFHWFVRAHLESSSGQLSTSGETTEKGAAEAARAAEH
ncbi:Dps family protein [Aquipuribacter sp. MA13-6]|uniref:Dps family protein n=1 Tax=unclassified Aquipuribacter TaxID=2635084 RepID=UPI003EEF66DF